MHGLNILKGEKVKKLACMLLSTLSVNSFGDVRLAFDVGTGNVDIPDELPFEVYTADDDVLALAGYAGYMAENKLIFDIGISQLSNESLFGFNDELQFTSCEVLVGYLMEYRKLYVEPKLGYARWRLEIDQGAFLNPGDEGNFKDTGYDPLFMITAGYRFGDVFGMSVSYKYQDFDYGKSVATVLGFDFAIR